MDSDTMKGQVTTMEVDGGDASAMDTNDESAPSNIGQKPWTEEETSDMHVTTDLLVAPQPSGMGDHQQMQEDLGHCHQNVWHLAEGVCEKRVVRRGEGLYGPMRGACCTTTLLLEHSTHDLDPSLVGYPLGQGSVQIGEGGTPLSALIDVALTSMKKGEVAEVSIRRLRDSEGELVLLVTLQDFTVVSPSWRLTVQEKYTSAAFHKEQGAQLFRDGKVYAAFAHFRTATRLLLSILPCTLNEDDEAVHKQHSQLLCQCYLNLAACQMKTGHHTHVVTNCTQALSIDPNNVKALFRRASANVVLGKLLLAQEDVDAGLRVEPHNRALLDLQQSVDASLAHSQSAVAQGLSKMFS